MTPKEAQAAHEKMLQETFEKELNQKIRAVENDLICRKVSQVSSYDKKISDEIYRIFKERGFYCNISIWRRLFATKRIMVTVSIDENPKIELPHDPGWY